jgi:hypothetical protein
MDLFRRSNGLAVLSIPLIMFTWRVDAHGHEADMSKIVEGSFASADPIVGSAAERGLGAFGC